MNATAGQRGAGQGRTAGTQTNTTAHLSKYVLRTAAPGGPFPLTVDILVPPHILTALLGKTCHGIRRQTGEQKNSSAGVGGGGQVMAATQVTGHSTPQSTVLKPFLKAALEEL